MAPLEFAGGARRRPRGIRGLALCLFLASLVLSISSVLFLSKTLGNLPLRPSWAEVGLNFGGELHSHGNESAHVACSGMHCHWSSGALWLDAGGDVVLCSQGSIEKRAYFEYSIQFWSGPVSVVFYVSKATTEGTVRALRFSALAQRPNTLIQVQYSAGEEFYPVNMLRNLALRVVPDGNAVFVSDVDFLISRNAYEYFRSSVDFLKVHPGAVFVVPCFEVGESSYDMAAGRRLFDKPPSSFEDFVALGNKGMLRQSKVKYFPHGHSCTDYGRWWTGRDLLPWRLPCFNMQYEPFVVVLKTPDFPLFDERFTGFGGNKVVHTLELFDRGFEFFNSPSGLYLLHLAHPPARKTVAIEKHREQVNVPLYKQVRSGITRVAPCQCLSRFRALHRAVQPYATILVKTLKADGGLDHNDNGKLLKHALFPATVAEGALQSDFQVGGLDLGPPSAACTSSLVSIVLVVPGSDVVVGDFSATIFSLTHQTYANLELIVVLDTPPLALCDAAMKAMRNDDRVRVVHNIWHRGRAWSLNYGLSVAKGKFVAVHDVGSISHADRFRVQVEALCNAWLGNSDVKIAGIRGTSSVLISGSSGEMLGIWGDMGTVLLNRELVLSRVGYLFPAATNGLDEWFARLSSAFGESGLPVMKVVCTFSATKESALSKLDPLLYWRLFGLYGSWMGLHEYARTQQTCDEGGDLCLPVAFPLLERNAWLSDSDCWLEVEEIPVSLRSGRIVAAMATIPERADSLRSVVYSLLPQVDRVGVYLNNWHSVPGWLDHPRISVAQSQEYGERQDIGKFFWLTKDFEGFYFTCDDDLLYPPDYVRRMIHKIELYQRAVVVGVHGTVFHDNWKTYYDWETRTVYHFKEKLRHDMLVEVLGTGTVAFHTDTLRNFNVKTDLRHPGMADVDVAVWAKRNGIPLISVARRKRWLLPVDTGETKTIYLQGRGSCSVQTNLILENGVDLLDTDGPEMELLRIVLGEVSSKMLHTQDIYLEYMFPAEAVNSTGAIIRPS